MDSQSTPLKIVTMLTQIFIFLPKIDNTNVQGKIYLIDEMFFFRIAILFSMLLKNYLQRVLHCDQNFFAYFSGSITTSSTRAIWVSMWVRYLELELPKQLSFFWNTS